MANSSAGRVFVEDRNGTYRLMWEQESWNGNYRVPLTILDPVETDLNRARFLNFTHHPHELEVAIPFATRVYVPYEKALRELVDIASDAFAWISCWADRGWSLRLDIEKLVAGSIIFSFEDDATASVFALRYT